jgi:hypothetical protein
MKTISKVLITSVFAVIVAAFVPVAKADEGNWATAVTLNQPMQIGNLVLAPGSYMFKLVDIWAPDVVAIFSVNTHHYEGMVMGMPAYRSHASEKSAFILAEAAKGSPETLQYWYYPDSNYGIEFLNPHTKIASIPGNAVQIAG